MQNTIRHDQGSTRSWLYLVIALLLLMAVTPFAQIYLASETESNARRGQQDTGGQTASPNPGKGFDQQEKVRQLLAKQYDTLYADEASIQKLLNLRGPTADFLGRNSATNRWLIAESKASDIDKAWNQLQNTTQAFVRAQRGTDFEIRSYLDTRTFARFSDPEIKVGWLINSEGHLGWIGDSQEFVYGVIEGAKVLVLVAP